MFFSIPLRKHEKEEKEGMSFRLENFIPGVVIGFILGMLIDFTKLPKNPPKQKTLHQTKPCDSLSSPYLDDEELKMVLVVRQDLKMGAGKIASQCAHAAMGMYAELMQSQRLLLRQWEQFGQAKIVTTCKNLKEMNRLQQEAESIGLPTFVVADAGRTQAIGPVGKAIYREPLRLFGVASGSKTVLAIGPGRKSVVDSVTGKQRLL